MRLMSQKSQHLLYHSHCIIIQSFYTAVSRCNGTKSKNSNLTLWVQITFILTEMDQKKIKSMKFWVKKNFVPPLDGINFFKMQWIKKFQKWIGKSKLTFNQLKWIKINRIDEILGQKKFRTPLGGIKPFF